MTRSLLEAFNVIHVDVDKVLIVLNNVQPKPRLSAAQVEKGLGRPTFTIPYGGDSLYRAVDVGKVYLLERPNEPTAIAISKLADQLVERQKARRGRQPLRLSPTSAPKKEAPDFSGASIFKLGAQWWAREPPSPPARPAGGFGYDTRRERLRCGRRSPLIGCAALCPHCCVAIRRKTIHTHHLLRRVGLAQPDPTIHCEL